MEFTFAHNRNDHKKICAAIRKRAVGGPSTLVVVFGLVLAAFPAAFALSHLAGAVGISSATTKLIVQAFLVVAFIVWPIRQFYRQYKNLQPLPDGACLATYRYEFSEDGVEVSADGCRCHYDWPFFTDFWQNKDTFFLMIDSMFALALPKSLFGSEEAQAEFFTYCDERIERSR